MSIEVWFAVGELFGLVLWGVLLVPRLYYLRHAKYKLLSPQRRGGVSESRSCWDLAALFQEPFFPYSLPWLCWLLVPTSHRTGPSFAPLSPEKTGKTQWCNLEPKRLKIRFVHASKFQWCEGENPVRVNGCILFQRKIPQETQSKLCDFQLHSLKPTASPWK